MANFSLEVLNPLVLLLSMRVFSVSQGFQTSFTLMCTCRVSQKTYSDYVEIAPKS